MGLDFSVVPSYFGVLLLGAGWTIAITIGAGLLSFFGGIVFAVAALYGHWTIRLPMRLPIREAKGRNHLHYSKMDSDRGRGRPLLRTVLELRRPDAERGELFTEDEKRFSAPTSMRDVEPSVHVWRRFKLGSKQ